MWEYIQWILKGYTGGGTVFILFMLIKYGLPDQDDWKHFTNDRIFGTLMVILLALCMWPRLLWWEFEDVSRK